MYHFQLHLLSNTVLLSSIDSILLILFQHRFDPYESLSLLLFRSFHFWLQSFVIRPFDLCFSSSWFSISDNLDARIASDLHKIIQNSFFQNTISLKAQLQDRFLRGRQIDFMIYEYFRVTDVYDTDLDYANYLYYSSRRWRSGIRYEMGRNVLSMSNFPSDDVSKKFVQITNTWVWSTQDRIPSRFASMLIIGCVQTRIRQRVFSE